MVRTRLFLLPLIAVLGILAVAIPLGRSHAVSYASSRSALSSHFAASKKPVRPLSRVQKGVYLLETTSSITGLNATTGALLWQFQPGGLVTAYGTFNSLLYVIGGQGLQTLYALNVTNGTVAWHYSPNGYLNNPGAPVVANSIIYVTVGSTDFKSTTFYALNASTGSQVWKFQQTTQVMSFAVNNGVVYVSTGYPSSVYAFSASNGTTIWHSQSVNATMYAGKVLDGTLFGDADGGMNSLGFLYAFNTSAGKLLWSSSSAGIINAAQGIAYVEAGTPGNTTACAYNNSNGSVIWCTPGIPIRVVQGRVYNFIDSGHFQVIQGSTGAVLWSKSDGYQATINGVVYAVGSNGSIEALKAADGTLLWNSHTTEGAMQVFLNHKLNLYVISASGTAVYQLAASTGSFKWNYQEGNEITDISIAAGIVYVAAFDNTVHALKASDGTLLWQH